MDIRQGSVYLCIDLKTFYASVECLDRGLDPLTTPLVVADPDRGPSTICLAVSPAMKRLGVRNRCRVFDIPKHLTYLTAKPHMQRYMEVSARIYSIYLEFISPEDIHVYSIDECFIDITPYRALYDTDAAGIARMLIDAVYERCGIIATAGIGTNLFLAKVALDVTAKHARDGIGWLDEERFRRTIWKHRPITDIWGIGPGIARRLAAYHVYDLMGVAALNEELLYREFGVSAEYLIDHAHGRESCTIADIHAYVPSATSTTSGQVLPRNYTFDEARVVLREMVDALVLDLVQKHLVCSHISLWVGYGHVSGAPAWMVSSGSAQRSACGASRSDDVPWEDPHSSPPAPPGRAEVFRGEHGTRPARGYAAYAHANISRALKERTNSFKKLLSYFELLWNEAVDTRAPIKRINIGCGNLMPEEFATCDLFTDKKAEAEERNLQDALIAIRGRFGKNSLLRGTSFRDSATGRERNQQIGGHHA